MPASLFGSSEKTNFIQNMKPEAYHRHSLRVLLSFPVLTVLLSAAAELLQIPGLPAAALVTSGCAALLFVQIGLLRRFTPKALLPAGILLLALTGWSFLSAALSFSAEDPSDYTAAIYGADGRGEGALSVLFCSCFLLLGAQIGSKDNRRKLLNGMLLTGLFQCVWGLLQALPIGFPSDYKDLEPLLEYRVFLPSGLTGSPILFAMLLAMLEFPAMLAAAHAEHKRSRIFYLVCTAAFAVMAVKTQCLTGVAGSALSILLGAAALLLRKTGRQGLTVILTAVIAFAAGAGWWFASPMLNGTYNDSDPSSAAVLTLYDGGIMWEDSSYRLGLSGYYIPAEGASPHGTFEIRSIPSVYGYLWKNTAEIIRQYPLTGTGPDSLVYAQLFESYTPAENPNTFDRAYNTYLHTAATLGIPALLLFCLVLGTVLLNGRKAAKGSWIQTAYLGAAGVYCILMLTGSSSMTVAPLFWMCAGVCSHMKKET